MTKAREDGVLPAWQAGTARNIHNYTHRWLADYMASPAWAKRPAGVTQDLLETVIGSLTERAYSEYRKTPKSWTKRAITGVMTGYLVSNTGLTDAEYDLVAPALNAWLAFVGATGELNAKRVSDYQRFITAAGPQMVAQAKDQGNFSPAKLVMNLADKQGVDLNDEAANRAFVEQLNAQGGIDALYDHLEDEATANDDWYSDEEATDDDGADLLATMLAHPDQLAEVAKLYDPDPQKTYLEMSHGTSWQRRTAMRVHELGVQAGVKFWLARQTYQLPADHEALDIIRSVSDFVDVIYAQHNQAPTDWSVPTMQAIGQWLRQTGKGQAVEWLYANLLRMLGSDDTLTRQQAKQLPAAILGDPIPKVRPQKVQGHGLSPKQARKLLKNKRRH